MINLVQVGTASVTALPVLPTVPIPMEPSVVTIPEGMRLRRGTFVCAAFSAVFPQRFDPDSWDGFGYDVPLPAVYDSKGNAWTTSGFTNGHFPFMWYCTLNTELAPGDTITATCMSFVTDPGPVGDLSGYRKEDTRTMGMRVFAFECIGNVGADVSLSGYGNLWNYVEKVNPQGIDVTPFGGTPYSPRLEIQLLGTAWVNNPDPIDPFTDTLRTLPLGVEPTAEFVLPDGYTEIGEVSAEWGTVRTSVPSPLGPPDYPPAVSPIDRWYTDTLCYRYLRPGQVQDSITLPGLDFGSGAKFYVHRGVFTFQLIEVPCQNAPSIDLLQLANGMLARSRREAENVLVARSPDGGATWPLEVVAATDAGAGAAPTLYRDPSDTLWVWYHDTADHVRGRVSYDFGETWEPYVVHDLGGRFPRAVRLAERMLLMVAKDGAAFVAPDRLVFYTSHDDGLTLEEITGAAISIGPPHLAALAVDRKGAARVAYFGPFGTISHRRLMDNDTWGEGSQLAAAGLYPAWATSYHGGLCLYWHAGELHGVTTDGFYFQVVGPTSSAPAGLQEGVMGLIADQRQQDHVLAGLDDDTNAPVTRVSGDDGESWFPPS